MMSLAKQIAFVLLIAFSFSLHANTSNIIKRDQKLLIEAITTLNHLSEAYGTNLSPILKKLEIDPYTVLKINERKTLNYFWTKFVDQRIALHTIYNTYDEFSLKNEQDNNKANQLKYSSLLHLLNSGAEISAVLWNNKAARKLFNEEFSKQIPRGSFISMENEIFKQYSLDDNMQNLPTHFPKYNYLRIKAQYLSIDTHELLEDSNSLSIQKLNDKIEIRFKEKFVPFLENYSNQSAISRRWFVYKFKNIFYSIMKSISTWIGDTKVRRRNSDYYNGQTLINIRMAKKMEAKLLPGDIMLSRTNWFISNAFLPGFWPHSFTYTGTNLQIKDYFDTDEETNYYISNLCLKENLNCTTLTQYLETSPKTDIAWFKLNIRDKYGYKKILIEATSDGVHFSTLRHTFLNDYLAALRPKLSKKDKAMSLIEMFKHHGKDYDFDFDYQTDDKLVCSELLAKSYASDSQLNKKGVDFYYSLDKEKYLQKYLGRLSLPVIGIAEKFYDESVLNIRDSQLDFIAFLKGNRREDNSSFTTKEEFQASKDWKKWSFLQD